MESYESFKTVRRTRQLTAERSGDLERHIIASLRDCVRGFAIILLKLCHAQTCGKCVPCRVGLLQLQNLMEDVLMKSNRGDSCFDRRNSE